ncbi:MAG: hypothetical protein LBE12_16090 [Planctomycetaceae bacterium]|nr:hypothetical protein [Planctomycetaceae bacterium]
MLNDLSPVAPRGKEVFAGRIHESATIHAVDDQTSLRGVFDYVCLSFA